MNGKICKQYAVSIQEVIKWKKEELRLWNGFQLH
nr:MAG TPA: hypothetical protein [Inoviridae sp.]